MPPSNNRAALLSKVALVACCTFSCGRPSAPTAPAAAPPKAEPAATAARMDLLNLAPGMASPSKHTSKTTREQPGTGCPKPPPSDASLASIATQCGLGSPKPGTESWSTTTSMDGQAATFELALAPKECARIVARRTAGVGPWALVVTNAAGDVAGEWNGSKGWAQIPEGSFLLCAATATKLSVVTTSGQGTQSFDLRAFVR
jgi:hypothetical protein